MVKLSVIALHGIGTQSKGFYNDLKSGLKKQFAQRSVTDYDFTGFLYASIAQAGQDDLWKRISKTTISLDTIRRFLLFYFGDAGSYSYKFDTPGSIYQTIHQRLGRAMKKALANLAPDGTLVVLAQSFGAFIVSNFLWDLFKRPNTSPLRESVSKKLKLMITTGCNIPLLVGGLADIKAFKKPNREFLWHNYYDKDDILGWPLRPLSDSYRKLVKQDIAVNTGLPILSHLNYWKNNKLLDAIADNIKDVM